MLTSFLSGYRLWWSIYSPWHVLSSVSTRYLYYLNNSVTVLSSVCACVSFLLKIKFIYGKKEYKTASPTCNSWTSNSNKHSNCLNMLHEEVVCTSYRQLSKWSTFMFLHSGCEYSGKYYEEGAVFTPFYNPCLNCSCIDRKVRCGSSCPPRPELNCTRPVTLPGDCCPSFCPSKLK